MKAEEITSKEFDEELEDMLREMKAIELLQIPGIYEIVSEEFNNEVIDRLTYNENWL